MEIACVGAGPAGLYVAILMKLQGPDHQVTVYERSPEDATHGVGVVFWDDLLTSLRESDAATADKVQESAFQWNDQVFARTGAPQIARSSYGFSMRRQTLLDILTERAVELGVEIRYGQDVDPAAPPVADLVVASDGAGSLLRQHRTDVFGTQIQVNRNKYVWLSTTKVFNSFTFGLVGTGSGHLWFHAYGFDTDASTFIVECAPETWDAVGFGSLDQAQSLHLLETLFAEHLDGHPVKTPIHQGSGLRWLHFQEVTNQTWQAGNVVLVGDAAHTTHFSIGSGTKLALEDAIALASHLKRNPSLEAALPVYADERKSTLAGFQRDAHLSAQWFEQMPRYVNFSDERLFDLLLDRRSTLLPRIPPLLFLQLKALRGALKRRLAGRGA